MPDHQHLCPECGRPLVLVRDGARFLWACATVFDDGEPSGRRARLVCRKCEEFCFDDDENVQAGFLSKHTSHQVGRVG